MCFLTAITDAMIYEVLEAVHHLDTSYAAFYTAMTTNGNMESLVWRNKTMHTLAVFFISLS